MAKKNFARITAWTDSGSKVELNGPIRAVANELFASLNTEQQEEFMRRVGEYRAAQAEQPPMYN
ncbi:hypothetical protein AAG587_08165 [Vreelandella neptunia]|uniref:hypothetical protein n=1 Tax=Vreelandella neptunia TaxID=115551 RepID=UPI003159A317